jgi:hypothetical protein
VGNHAGAADAIAPWQALQTAVDEFMRVHHGTTSQAAMAAVLQANPALAAAVRALERQGHRRPSHFLHGTMPTRKKADPTPDSGNNAVRIMQKLAQDMVTRGDVGTVAQGIDRVLRDYPELMGEYRRLKQERA